MRNLPWAAVVTAAVASSSVGGAPRAEDKRSARDDFDDRQATYVSGPKDSAGLIDYAAALNERFGRGVTPDRNACAALWRAIGPPPDHRPVSDDFFAALGIERPPSEGNYFVDWDDFLRERRPDEIERNAINDAYMTAQNEAWTAEQYPDLAAWLEANRRPLAEVRRAVELPHFYYPLVPRTDDGKPTSLMNQLVPEVGNYRDLARALTARAMLRAGEGKLDEAFDDLTTCRLLGRQTARGPTLVWYMVGTTIDSMSAYAETRLLFSVRLTEGRLRRRRLELEGLSPFPPLKEAFDLGERFVLLDLVQRLDEGDRSIAGVFFGKNLFEPASDDLIEQVRLLDFRPVMQDVNRAFDRLGAALRENDPVLRRRRVQAVVDSLQADAPEQNQAEPRLVPRIDANLNVAEIGRYFAALFVPGAAFAASHYDNRLQTADQLITAYRLEAHRLRHGRYPATLAELAAPAAETIDRFTGRPQIYRVRGDGYVLYSVGPNGVDDGGRNLEDDEESSWDDLRIGPKARSDPGVSH